MDLVAGFALMAVVLTVSALLAGVVERAPLSFPMLFVGLGFLAGPPGLGLVDIGVHHPALEIVATSTLALVLFLDAVNLEFARERHEWLIPALTLGPGTVLIVLMIAGSAILLLDVSPVIAFLLGAILSSTDPVVLRDVVRDRRLPGAVRQALKIEAGTNDVIVLPLLLVLIAVGNQELGDAGEWLAFAGKLLILGPLVGFVVGAAGAELMARADERFGIRREYQALYGIGLVLGAYAAGVGVGGDGFLAAFAAGFAVTILDRELCDCFLEFGEAAAEMLMLVAFVMFGVVLSKSFGILELPPSLAFAALTIFLIRPLAVGGVLSLRAARLSRSAQLFIAWFGPRGLNSMLFALLVVIAEVPGNELLFAAAGLVVVVSIVAHGASATPLVNRYAHLLERDTLAEERETTASGLFLSSPDEVERISVDELHDLLEGSDGPVVLDVRSRSQYERDDGQIPGSVRVMADEVTAWSEDPPGRLVVPYCT
ncbi:MAG TPA: cation:proton antiporter [Actinomycetota bacterium]|nr:cation:proton antiporter [Actinomycetota bacterium]